MVSGRHRTARPGTLYPSSLPLPFLEDSLANESHVVVSTRRVSAQAHRPRFKPHLQGYSHINIQQRATAAEPPAETDNKEEDFVRKESIQEEIEDQLLYKIKLASNQESPHRPRTFAEATMSTRIRGRGGRKDSIKESDATLSGPMSLESLGPFKYTFKKKKKANKWSPFDLRVTDSASEVGSISEADAASSRAVSPNPQSIFGSASIHSSPRKLLSTPIIHTFSPGKGTENGRLIEGVKVNDIGETHQTPTQNSFEFTPLAPAAGDPSADADSFLDSIPYNIGLDEVDSNTSDTQSTKDRTEAAMSLIMDAFGTGKVPKVGEDAFDSVKWDPDLPTASTPDSPEIVPIAPKPVEPVAYTTVGSIVKNAVPLPTAPNRIQREGAGRRPLMTFTNRPLMPIRHQESSYFHLRDPPPPLNVQNSMHSTQPLSQSPVRFYQPQQPTSSHSSRSTLSLRQMSLSEDEQKVLKRAGPQMSSGTVANSPAPRSPSTKLFAGSTASDVKSTAETSLTRPFANNDGGLQTLLSNDLFGEDGQRRSAPLSGLEKMQTIQRLAKFENPMRELARSRLSALSVTNCLGRTVANPNGVSTPLSCTTLDSNSCKVPPGELDRSYQFPPLGFTSSSVSQSAHLLGSHSSSALWTPSNRSSGVPRPLTAGPPGQRQYLTTGAPKATSTLNEPRRFGSEVAALNTTYAEYLCNTSSQSQLYYSSLNQQASTTQLSLSGNMETSQTAASVQQERAAAFEGEIVGSKLVDTLPPSILSQYYPYGFPTNMTGKYEPLPHKMMLKMGQIPDVCEPATAEEKAAARQEEVKNWFYSRQQQFAKTIDDHINDMEERERNRGANPFGAIGQPKKTTLPVEKPITIEEMKEMTIAEATAPLLNAAFGTLLGYADQTSESRTRLSGWEKSPDWLIDSGEKGNVSCFGEDWGRPPKHAIGTRRYQPAIHTPSATY